ncbi:MAG: histidinol-phosphatase [Spirochaetaceae bacterium]|jgi:histidinol-phosphatase (PHP family)|nr:histidinol-phosphatase [Spirochaetaceae bacterium]
MKTNYHTHSVFCDGSATAEEMVLAGIDAGLDIIGLSAHAMWPYSSLWHLPAGDYGAYAAEVRRLQGVYGDSITVLLGFEADYRPPLSVPTRDTYAQFAPDFLIGSVHYIAGGAFCVDAPADDVGRGLADRYRGNGKDLVRDYYGAVRECLRTCDFDIMGHIDVVRKRNGQIHFFDEGDSWYRDELEETARAAAESAVIVEINTGGIARGAIDDVYPSGDFLSRLHAHGVPVMINSDAHVARDITCAFDRAKKAAKDAGYTETAYILGGKRFFTPL